VWVFNKIVVVEDCRWVSLFLTLVRSASVLAQRPTQLADLISFRFLRSAVIIMTTFVMLFLMALLALS